MEEKKQYKGSLSNQSSPLNPTVMNLNGLCHVSLCLLGVPAALGSPCCGPDLTSRAYHDYLLKGYIAMGVDNLSLIDTILHPDVVLYVYRFPPASGKGSSVAYVTSRKEFIAFVERFTLME
jgi:hypothetical protein